MTNVTANPPPSSAGAARCGERGAPVGDRHRGAARTTASTTSTGGTHHSVAIDQPDHIVVVEAPQNEARSLAVIAKVKETIPNKPIRYLINTHHHFDHSGGLRTYVDEGATIVTHQMNQAVLRAGVGGAADAQPRPAGAVEEGGQFETFSEKHVLTDGKRSIEIHRLAGNGHNDAFAMVYLPAEKILIEVDAWAPPAPMCRRRRAEPLYDEPARKHPTAAARREQIAALHGPRVATFAESAAAMRPSVTTNE